MTRRGPGGRGGGQEEGAPRLLESPQPDQGGGRRRGGKFGICRLAQPLVVPWKKFQMKETYEVFRTSYLNEGQCKTDKDVMVLGHMAIIPFPVLCKCRKVLKRTKTTKINCKDDETGAELCQNQNSLVIAGGDVWRRR